MRGDDDQRGRLLLGLERQRPAGRRDHVPEADAGASAAVGDWRSRPNVAAAVIADFYARSSERLVRYGVFGDNNATTRRATVPTTTVLCRVYTPSGILPH